MIKKTVKKFINAFLSIFDVILLRKSSIENPQSNNFRDYQFERLKCDLNKTISELSRQNKVEIIKAQIQNRWSLNDSISAGLNNENHINCPLCDANLEKKLISKFESHCIFGGGRLVRYQCSDCDLIFGPEKILNMSDAQLSDEYSLHYSVYSEGDSTEQEIRAFHALNPSKNGMYLNFGAGAWSKSIKILRDEGWNVYGYEPYSQNTSEFIITDEKILESMKFDGIFSNNVLEHFNHPVDEMRKMSRYLKEDGRMSHATPCFEYLYEYTRFHLFFFLGRSSNILAKKAGLKVIEYIKDEEFMCLVLKEEKI